LHESSTIRCRKKRRATNHEFPYFLDTNILIYATSLADDHAAKRPLARSWVARADWGLSTQV
jgi:predicted nucleic acid-binding protein